MGEGEMSSTHHDPSTQHPQMPPNPPTSPTHQDQSVQQMSDAAKQFAAGAKDFYTARVAPAAKDAIRSVQQAADDQRRDQQPGMRRWSGWGPFLLPSVAFVALVSLFLPAVTAFGISMSYFSDATEGEGGILLTLFLVVIIASVVVLALPATWLRVITGILGIIVGLIGAMDGFGTITNVSHHAAVGAGLVLLTTFSIALIFAGLLTLLNLRRPATETAPIQGSHPAPPQP